MDPRNPHHTLKGDQDFGLCQTVISTNFPTDWQDSHNADKHQRRPSRYLSILVKISLHRYTGILFKAESNEVGK